MNDSKQPAPTQPSDPLIDEIRAIREKISNQFGNDVGKLCDFLRDQQHEHGERVVNETEPQKTTSSR